ncbi:MAG TPA: DUF2218 domain-containing protein [Streptosporangiaceae bacterium]|jgi:hypothetical protein
MPASHAHVPTTRASRYLAQLGSHGRHPGQGALGRAHGQHDGGEPPAPRLASWTSTDGVLDFGWGRCILHASGDALTLRAEAGDQQQLERIQDGITARLERIGRRGHLALAWNPVPPDAGPHEAGRG